VARLSHPNVVALYDAGPDYLVMAYIDGQNLAQRLHSPMVPAEALGVVLQLASALAHAHERGVVHRDVKPGNVLHAGDGTWKVADFGIAKSTEALDTMTGTGEVLCTPGYVAPERLAGEPATAASDLYSLGVVLYEALSGRRPFIADSAIGVAHLVRTAEADPLEEVRPGVDPDLTRVVHTALAREPSQRFADAGQMREALAALRGSPARSDGDSSTVAVEVPSITQTRVARFPLVDDRPSRAGAGRAAKAALVAAAAALVVGLASVAIGSGGDGGPGVGVTPPSAGVTTPPPDASGPGTGPMPLADALDRLEETVQQ
jgi:serine/threonine-protein kinase